MMNVKQCRVMAIGVILSQGAWAQLGPANRPQVQGPSAGQSIGTRNVGVSVGGSSGIGGGSASSAPASSGISAGVSNSVGGAANALSGQRFVFRYSFSAADLVPSSHPAPANRGGARCSAKVDPLFNQYMAEFNNCNSRLSSGGDSDPASQAIPGSPGHKFNQVIRNRPINAIAESQGNPQPFYLQEFCPGLNLADPAQLRQCGTRVARAHSEWCGKDYRPAADKYAQAQDLANRCNIKAETCDRATAERTEAGRRSLSETTRVAEQEARVNQLRQQLVDASRELQSRRQALGEAEVATCSRMAEVETRACSNFEDLSVPLNVPSVASGCASRSNTVLQGRKPNPADYIDLR